MISYRERDQVHYIGASDDDKPVRADDGSDFLESDTLDLWQYDGSDWFFVRNLAGGSGGPVQVVTKQWLIISPQSALVPNGATQYISPKDVAYHSTELLRQTYLPQNGRVTGLWCWNGQAPTDDDVTLTVRINGVDSNIVVTVPQGAAVNSIHGDDAHEAEFNAGDKLSVKIVNADSVGWVASHMIVTIRLD